MSAKSLEALRELELENGDVIIIGSINPMLQAEIGAYSAALNYFERSLSNG